MADQEGTSGFIRAFLPGLVLGILIGAATTFTFFTLSEGGELPGSPDGAPTERTLREGELATPDEPPAIPPEELEQPGDEESGGEEAADDGSPGGPVGRSGEAPGGG